MLLRDDFVKVEYWAQELFLMSLRVSIDILDDHGLHPVAILKLFVVLKTIVIAVRVAVCYGPSVLLNSSLHLLL